MTVAEMIIQQARSSETDSYRFLLWPSTISHTRPTMTVAIPLRIWLEAT